MNTRGPSTSDSTRERVYLDFYNLDESPFSITPDPEYLYYSVTHQNAINKLLYGINSRMGFLLLVGEVGTGKTTICRSLLDNLENKASTVYIINPSLSGTELISSILDDLNIAYPKDASKKELINALNSFFLTADSDKPLVIIIDDAQTMHIDSLEDMRLLSNLETDKEKLLQILLVGQPELLTQLSRPEMRQLKQRVALTCRLDALSRTEVEGYISRRLFVAGDKGRIRFKSDAIRRIFSISKGTPRIINRLCDYALTAGYVADTHEISQGHVKKAVKELKGLWEGDTSAISSASGKRKWLLILAVISLVYSGIVVAVWYMAPRYLPTPPLAGSPPIAESLPQTKLEPVPVAMAKQEAPQPGATLEENMAKTTRENETPPPMETTATSPDKRNKTYIIRVASFRTLKRVEKATAQLRKNDIQSYSKFVDLGEKGQWYGLYTGRFKTLEEAIQFRADHKLYDAVIEHRYAEE
ncbi:MAG: AAA family ATPase [Desulfobacterales bacterium]|nr:AAA family ATPase [Desulfobacterales bacterium]MDX2511280.1 AAA family ATPase [Desulfobacterales bacterium]